MKAAIKQAANAFKGGADGSVFRKAMLERHSVFQAGKVVHSIYGNGPAIGLGRNNTHFYFLTGGLGEREKRQFLKTVPSSFKVSGEKNLDGLGAYKSNVHYNFIILPTPNRTSPLVELARSERESMPVPKARVVTKSVRSGLWEVFIYATNQLEAQALLKMMNGFDDFKVETDRKKFADNWRMSWGMGFEIARPEVVVSMPKPGEFQFKVSDFSRRPLRSAAAFLSGVLAATNGRNGSG